MKAGWKSVPMGLLCSIKNGKSDTQDAVEDGEYEFFDWSRTVKRSSRFLFDCEALIIPGEGTEFLPRHFIGKFDLHQRAYALHNFSSEIDARFLYFYLHHKAAYLPSVAVGATVKSLRMRHFETLPVLITAIVEQQRIVTILDEAFEGIATATANAEINLRKARELFQNHLKGILRNPKYPVKNLGQLCNGVEYGTSSKSEQIGRTPVLRMGNIQQGKLDWSDLVYSNNQTDIKKYALRFNDVLFNRTNSLELVGKTATYKGEMPAIFAGYLIRVNRIDSLLDADYLCYYLNSSDAIAYGKTVVISSVHQANINGSKLKAYPIPAPSLAEQKQIVEQLDELAAEVTSLDVVYKQKLDALAELKKSILHQAFSGQLHQGQYERS
jgi:type I restriction enzyme S subunit